MIQAQQQSAGASSNAGVARAGGDFIYFLDADDEVFSGGVGHLVESLRTHPDAGLAVGGYIRHSEGRSDKLRMPDGYTGDRTTNARRRRNEVSSSRSHRPP